MKEKELKFYNIKQLPQELQKLKTKSIERESGIRFIKRKDFHRINKSRKIIGSINKNQTNFWSNQEDCDLTTAIKISKGIIGIANLKIANRMKHFDIRKTRRMFVSGYVYIGNDEYLQVIDKCLI